MVITLQSSLPSTRIEICWVRDSRSECAFVKGGGGEVEGREGGGIPAATRAEHKCLAIGSCGAHLRTGHIGTASVAKRTHEKKLLCTFIASRYNYNYFVEEK